MLTETLSPSHREDRTIAILDVEKADMLISSSRIYYDVLILR